MNVLYFIIKIECVYSQFSTTLQLNGVELPCGTTIHVEPANTEYKKTKYHKNSETKTEDAPQIKSENQKAEIEEDDENLDDFFASL